MGSLRNVSLGLWLRKEFYARVIGFLILIQSMFESAFSKKTTHLVTRSSHGLISKEKTARFLLEGLCSAFKGFIGLLVGTRTRGLHAQEALICG